MSFIAIISDVFMLLNKVTFSRKRLKLFTSRILQERFFNDSLANLREAYILVNFSHLAQKIFSLSI